MKPSLYFNTTQVFYFVVYLNFKARMDVRVSGGVVVLECIHNKPVFVWGLGCRAGYYQSLTLWSLMMSSRPFSLGSPHGIISNENGVILVQNIFAACLNRTFVRSSSMAYLSGVVSGLSKNRVSNCSRIKNKCHSFAWKLQLLNVIWKGDCYFGFFFLLI